MSKAKPKERDPMEDCAAMNAEEWNKRPAGYEQAYRRGYFQGFFAAMEAAERETGKDLPALGDYLYGPLFGWRYGNTMKMDLPPGIASSAASTP